ncbi:hypothetical protein ACF1AE_26915, partial [Streptomyces sp. NPDC014986]|uniref:hypothetical protein n=1 Tax=Streptomyces sp. NPDC014986 TaxID=3364934 RepID=UPI003701B25F
REIGTDYPPPGDRVDLLRSADLVVHLHEIRPGHPLPRRREPLADDRGGAVSVLWRHAHAPHSELDPR